MNKLFRVGMSFAIVLVAYWAYALVVVPVIAPSLDPDDRQTVAQQIIDTAGDRARLKSQELASLFPPGSWELVDKPMVLESDQAKLLVGEYTPLPDGRVSLEPCTIIFFPKKELQDAPLAEREAILLEAPEGAELQFDGSFDLSRGKLGNGRIVGGHIKGPVTIRSQGKLNDPSDDLWVTTRNIALCERWITTDSSVRFKYGKHNGAGRRMRMELEQEDEDRRGKKKGQGPRIVGLRSFQLREMDYLRLFIPEEDKEKKVAGASAGKTEPTLIPVEIGCARGFRLDVPERRAAFQDDVVVSRFRTDGPADRLSCDELVIHFTPQKKKASQSKKKSEVVGIADLEPSWLEARGTKRLARIRSAADQVDAFASEFQYHLSDRRIVLQAEKPKKKRPDGEEERSGREVVRLNQAGNTFIAKYLEYRPSQDPTRQIGQLVADGPGIITARLGKESDDLFIATWQKELRLSPHGKNQVISLTGGATLDYGPTGKLSADTIHFYTTEKPAEQGGTASAADPEKKMAARLQPDKMQADGNVEIRSKQLSGNVDQCQFWFETVQGPPVNHIDPSKSSGTLYDRKRRLYQTDLARFPVVEGPTTNATVNNTHLVPVTSGYRGAPPRDRRSSGSLAGPPLQPGMATGPTSGMTPPFQEKQQHFHITGRLLQANVLIREYPIPDGNKKRDTEVTELKVFDNVRLVETQTDKPNVEPVIVKGDRIHVIDATLPSASVNVFGRPAEFVGRGLGLAGATIHLNRGTNELSVDGPGTMRLPPMKQDLRGKTLDQAEPIIINWQRGMHFDGQTIQFREQVLAETKNQKLYTEQLVATLTEKIDFSKEKTLTTRQPDLLLLTCHGGVRLNNNTFDKLGRIEATESAEMNYLKVDNVSDKVYAKGPGYVRSVRRNQDGSLQRQIGLPGSTGMTTTRPRPAYGNPSGQEADDSDKLIYVKVRFQGHIDGDIEGRLMAFNNQVRGTFGQVADWNEELPEDDPDSLGNKGALLKCRRLQLVQMPSPAGGDPSVEMEATGNVKIEGSQFTANGHRASYSRQKELLILEGYGGRTNATLYRQEKAGTAPDEIPAKKIMYWPELNQYKLGGAQSIQFQVNPSR